MKRCLAKLTLSQPTRGDTQQGKDHCAAAARRILMVRLAQYAISDFMMLPS